MGERSDTVMATLCIGYKTYCMPIDNAVAVAKALAVAELYDTKYRPKDEGGTTHHIFPQENTNGLSVHLINADLYRMAKLAGKPE